MPDEPTRYHIQTLLDTAVQPCRPQTDDEFAALVADMRRTNGRPQVPIAVSADGTVFDGTHRLRAMLKLGKTYIPAEDVKAYPDVTTGNLSERAIALNAARRQWTTAEKADQARQLRKDGWSQTRIARAFGVTQPAVSQWLRDDTPEDRPAAVQGLDSKVYPVLAPEPRERRERPSTHPWAPSSTAYTAAQRTLRDLEGLPAQGLNELHRAKAVDLVLRVRDGCGAWLAEAGYEE